MTPCRDFRRTASLGLGDLCVSSGFLLAPLLVDAEARSDS